MFEIAGTELLKSVGKNFSMAMPADSRCDKKSLKLRLKLCLRLQVQNSKICARKEKPEFHKISAWPCLQILVVKKGLKLRLKLCLRLQVQNCEKKRVGKSFSFGTAEQGLKVLGDMLGRFSNFEGHKWGVRSVVVEFGGFWGPPDFPSRGPQIPIFEEFWGPLDGKSGRPKNAKFNHDGSDPPFAAL